MAVLKMEAPDLGFGFAWEPESRNLYIIHASGMKHEQIAGGVASPEHAGALASMWCMGYRSRMREIVRPKGVSHYHMLAESGQLGWAQGKETQS